MQTCMYTYSLLHIDTHTSVVFWFTLKAFGFLCHFLFSQRIPHMFVQIQILFWITNILTENFLKWHKDPGPKSNITGIRPNYGLDPQRQYLHKPLHSCHDVKWQAFRSPRQKSNLTKMLFCLHWDGTTISLYLCMYTCIFLLNLYIILFINLFIDVKYNCSFDVFLPTYLKSWKIIKKCTSGTDSVLWGMLVVPGQSIY